MIDRTITTQVRLPSQEAAWVSIRPGPDRAELIRKAALELLQTAEESRYREEIHQRLVETVQRLTGATRVILEPIGASRRVLLRSGREVRSGTPEGVFSLQHQGNRIGRLLIASKGINEMPVEFREGIEMLCRIAAIADRVLLGQFRSRLGVVESPKSEETWTGLVIPFVQQQLALSRRRHEPLGLMVFGIDEPGGIEFVSGTILRSIRESDLMIRADDSTLMTLFPCATQSNLIAIAEDLLRRIADSERLDPTLLHSRGVTVGIAAYPDDADNANLLLDQATQALLIAQSYGPGAIVLADADAPERPRIRWPSGAQEPATSDI